MEEIDKRYSYNLTEYIEQLKVCKNIKNKLAKIVEKKNSLELQINSLNKEIHNMKLSYSLNKIKGSDNSIMYKSAGSKSFLSIFKYGFSNSDIVISTKKGIVDQELIKLKKNLELADEEVNKMNQILLGNVIY
jgi:hypothetical protein